MKPGSVVLTELLQADGTRKVRPVLVLALVPPFDDSLVCGIFTQLRQAVPNFDDILTMGDPDFETSGLKTTSLVRLGFLSSLPDKRIAGVLGVISPDRLHRLRKNFADFIARKP